MCACPAAPGRRKVALRAAEAEKREAASMSARRLPSEASDHAQHTQPTAADGPHSTQNQGGRGVWPAGGGGGGGGEVATATVGSNSTVGCEVS